MKKKNSFKESNLTSTLSNLFSSNVITILTISTSIVLNRGLGPELKGQYVSLIILTNFYMPLLLFGYPGGILFYSLRKEIEISKFYLTGLVTVIFTGIIAAILIYLCVINGLFGEILANIPQYILNIIIYTTPFVFLNGYLQRVIFSHKLFRPSNIRNVVAALIIFLGSSVLWCLGILTLKNSVIVLSISLLVNTFLNLYFINNLFPLRVTLIKNQIFKPWKFGFKDFVSTTIAEGNNKFDQIILGFLVAPQSFGIYSAGLAISNLVSIIPSSYTSVFYTKIISIDADSAARVYEKAVRVSFLISIIVSIILVVVAKYLIIILYGNAYIEASIVVYFYIIGVVFQIITALNIKFFASRGKPLKNAIIYLLSFSLSIPFYFWFIPMYGLKGAAIASSIGYFSAFIFSLYQLRREYPVIILNFFTFSKSDFEFLRTIMCKLRLLAK